MISWLEIPWTVAAVTIAALFGFNVGSFLNVVIWRLPRGGSLAEPTWSYCPHCEHKLGGLDLIPVLSFVALRARCRYCGGPISWRYPAIETLTGLLFAAVAWRFSGTQDFGAAVDIGFTCLFVGTLVCVFFIDLEHFVIPDGLNLLGFLIGLVHWAVLSLLVGPRSLPRAALVGGLSYSGALYAVGLLAYVALVGVGARKGVFASAGRYFRENAADWAWLLVYYAGAIVPALRRYVEPPIPLEGATAAEIEADEEEGGMGGGDAKLALSLGANLLWPLWLHSLMYAILIGFMQGVVILIRTRRRLGQRTALPFGPALVGGALIALFFGQDIWNWYVGHYLSYPGSPYVSPAAQ